MQARRAGFITRIARHGLDDSRRLTLAICRVAREADGAKRGDRHDGENARDNRCPIMPSCAHRAGISLLIRPSRIFYMHRSQLVTQSTLLDTIKRRAKRFEDKSSIVLIY